MHLIEIFLPLTRNDGSDQPRALFAQVRAELLGRFGGLTAYSRAPAKGLWEEPDGGTARDELVIYEVMAQALDRDWWRDYRAELQRRFGQQEILLRAQEVVRL